MRHRFFLILFISSWALLLMQVRWHVRALDSAIRRDGLSSHATVAAQKVLLDLYDPEEGPYRLHHDVSELRRWVGSGKPCEAAVKDVERLAVEPTPPVDVIRDRLEEIRRHETNRLAQEAERLEHSRLSAFWVLDGSTVFSVCILAAIATGLFCPCNPSAPPTPK